jgi:DNA-binding beta-propeller fold protein YncE
MKGQNMTQLKSSKSERASVGRAPTARLFVLEASGNRMLSVNPDGSDRKVLVTDCRIPDGIVVDVDRGHIYWTNMGVPSRNDGSIERVDLDGRNRTAIVPQGGTFTPKQLQLDNRNGKLYWCDREGMRVMRCNLDGSTVETLVDTSQGDPRPGPDVTKWCVGVAVDVDGGKVYWTQKGGSNSNNGRIFRANIAVPPGQTAANRRDIDLIYDGLPEPIDLEIDQANRTLYWTDRGDPPRGNTVNRAPLYAPSGKRPAPEILFTHLEEGIGIALDLKGGQMFLTDLAGSVYSAKLDGSEKRTLVAAQGNLTGIAFAEIPQPEN